MKLSTVSVVIPAYNEAKNIATVLHGLRDYSSECEIIVVDDGSTDGTGDAAAAVPGVKVVSHPYNIGYGAALKTGIRAASGETIVMMDSDGQHRDYADIDRLIEHIGEFDMVVGARTGEAHRPMLRRPGKWLLGKIANYLVKQNIPDINSGFRAFRRHAVLQYLPLLSDQFSFTTTQTLMMFSEGKRVKYIPIKVYKRGGKSTVRIFRDGFNTILLMLRAIMLFNPLRVFLPISLILFLIGAGRLATGLIVGQDYTITSIFGLLSAILVFLIGLLADQVASLRKENVRLCNRQD